MVRPWPKLRAGKWPSLLLGEIGPGAQAMASEHPYELAFEVTAAQEGAEGAEGSDGLVLIQCTCGNQTSQFMEHGR